MIEDNENTSTADTGGTQWCAADGSGAKCQAPEELSPSKICGVDAATFREFVSEIVNGKWKTGAQRWDAIPDNAWDDKVKAREKALGMIPDTLFRGGFLYGLAQLYGNEQGTKSTLEALQRLDTQGTSFEAPDEKTINFVYNNYILSLSIRSSSEYIRAAIALYAIEESFQNSSFEQFCTDYWSYYGTQAATQQARLAQILSRRNPSRFNNFATWLKEKEPASDSEAVKNIRWVFATDGRDWVERLRYYGTSAMLTLIRKELGEAELEGYAEVARTANCLTEDDLVRYTNNELTGIQQDRIIEAARKLNLDYVSATITNAQAIWTEKLASLPAPTTVRTLLNKAQWTDAARLAVTLEPAQQFALIKHLSLLEVSTLRLGLCVYASRDTTRKPGAVSIPLIGLHFQGNAYELVQSMARHRDYQTSHEVAEKLDLLIAALDKTPTSQAGPNFLNLPGPRPFTPTADWIGSVSAQARAIAGHGVLHGAIHMVRNIRSERLAAYLNALSQTVRLGDPLAYGYDAAIVRATLRDAGVDWALRVFFFGDPRMHNLFYHEIARMLETAPNEAGLKRAVSLPISILESASTPDAAKETIYTLFLINDQYKRELLKEVKTLPNTKGVEVLTLLVEKATKMGAIFEGIVKRLQETIDSDRPPDRVDAIEVWNRLRAHDWLSARTIMLKLRGDEISKLYRMLEGNLFLVGGLLYALLRGDARNRPSVSRDSILKITQKPGNQSGQVLCLELLNSVSDEDLEFALVVTRCLDTWYHNQILNGPAALTALLKNFGDKPVFDDRTRTDLLYALAIRKVYSARLIIQESIAIYGADNIGNPLLASLNIAGDTVSIERFLHRGTPTLIGMFREQINTAAWFEGDPELNEDGRDQHTIALADAARTLSEIADWSTLEAAAAYRTLPASVAAELRATLRRLKLGHVVDLIAMEAPNESSTVDASEDWLLPDESGLNDISWDTILLMSEREKEFEVPRSWFEGANFGLKRMRCPFEIKSIKLKLAGESKAATKKSGEKIKNTGDSAASGEANLKKAEVTAKFKKQLGQAGPFKFDFSAKGKATKTGMSATLSLGATAKIYAKEAAQVGDSEVTAKIVTTGSLKVDIPVGLPPQLKDVAQVIFEGKLSIEKEDVKATMREVFDLTQSMELSISVTVVFVPNFEVLLPIVLRTLGRVAVVIGIVIEVIWVLADLWQVEQWKHFIKRTCAGFANLAEDRFVLGVLLGIGFSETSVAGLRISDMKSERYFTGDLPAGLGANDWLKQAVSIMNIAETKGRETGRLIVTSLAAHLSYDSAVRDDPDGTSTGFSPAQAEDRIVVRDALAAVIAESSSNQTPKHLSTIKDLIQAQYGVFIRVSLYLQARSKVRSRNPKGDRDPIFDLTDFGVTGRRGVQDAPPGTLVDQAKVLDEIGKLVQDRLKFQSESSP